MIFINHEDELTWKNQFQVLYFNATWMPFNQKVTLMLDKVAEKFPSLSFFAIDTDYFEVLCRRFDINSIPTVLIMENGKEVKRIEEVLPTHEFVAIFDDICSLKHNTGVKL